jgi:hypothetical protein
MARVISGRMVFQIKGLSAGYRSLRKRVQTRYGPVALNIYPRLGRKTQTLDL